MKRLLLTLFATVALVGAAQAQRPEGMPPGDRVMGTVTAAAGGKLTVQTPDGEQWTVISGDNTRITHEREPAKLAEIQPGAGVMAFGQKDAQQPNTLRAVFVGFQTAAEVRERQATFGKTWIAGKVKSVNGTQITLDVMVPGENKPAQKVIAVDENTSFARGRESITLADVHPGDGVMGQGQLKNGVFTPVKLQVRTPGSHERGPGGKPGVEAGGPPPPPQQ